MRQNKIPYIAKKYKDFMHIYDPIFCQNFFITIGKNPKLYIKLMERYNQKDMPPPDASGRFSSIEYAEQECGIIWSNGLNKNLMHECLHATFWLMETRGIGLNETTEEIFAYYQGFLYDTITKVWRTQC